MKKENSHVPLRSAFPANSFSYSIYLEAQKEPFQKSNGPLGVSKTVRLVCELGLELHRARGPPEWIAPEAIAILKEATFSSARFWFCDDESRKESSILEVCVREGSCKTEKPENKRIRKRHKMNE